MLIYFILGILLFFIILVKKSRSENIFVFLYYFPAFSDLLIWSKIFPLNFLINNFFINNFFKLLNINYCLIQLNLKWFFRQMFLQFVKRKFCSKCKIYKIKIYLFFFCYKNIFLHCILYKYFPGFHEFRSQRKEINFEKIRN